MQLKIHVRTLGHKEGIVTAYEDDLVEAFNKRLEQTYGIPAKMQKILVENCDDLLPGHRLKEYDLGTKQIIILAQQLPDCPREGGPDLKVHWQPSRLVKKAQGRGKSKEAATRNVKALPPSPGTPPPTAQQLQAAVARGEERAKAQAAQERREAATARAGDAALRSAVPPNRPLSRVASADGAAMRSRDGEDSAGARSNGPHSARSQAPSPGPAAAAAAAVAASAASAKAQARSASKASPKTASSKPGAPPTAPGGSGAGSARQNPPSRPAATTQSLSWSPPITGSHAPGAGTPKAPQPPVGDLSPPGTARVGVAPTAAPGAPTVNLSLVQPQAGSPPGSVRGAAGGNVNAAVPVAGVTRIRRTDLQRIGRLGVGAFGLVTLEADRRTGRTYALKAVSKGYLAHLRMEYSVLNEKRILKMLDTPFVVRLLATYNGREHVYFLLEAALGGELFTTYERLRLYGSEPHARFYVACVTEALAHLHERNVIYRDLKPENLLLDSRGFCKVTDMGLAKITTGQTYTMVGTPDYMAPEVIDQSGHTRSVDWWTLGVLLFELLAGHAPFESKTGNAQETYSLVKKGIEIVRFPETLRAEASHLVRSLCHRSPEMRTRTPKLREHGFFNRFDWPALCAQRMSPPLVPQVRGPRDLANFRDCENEDPQAMPYQDTGSGWDVGFEDDVLSVGASAAAAQAPMLPLPAGGPSSSSTAVGGYRHVPVVAGGASAVVPANSVPLQQQHHLQAARRVGSPPCSPRTAVRQLTNAASASRLQATATAVAASQNSTRAAWQAHTDRKMGTGSFVPPMVRAAGTNLQSPPSSPVLGGG